jgi:UMF1 family MFS transporter
MEAYSRIVGSAPPIQDRMSIPESEIATTAGELAVADAIAARHGQHVVTRRSVASWVLYDLANTIFSMGIVSLFFPAFVQDVKGKDAADLLVGNITAISMAIIFVVSPILGAMTDRARRRIPFLIMSTILCVGLTAVMGHVSFGMTALLFVIANIAYQAGLQFYDALLPEVSTEENRGKIGGIGVGIGYLGSYIAIALGFTSLKSSSWVFTVIAFLFLAFALPAFIFVKERGNPRPQPFDLGMAVESTKETVRTLRSSQQYPGLLRFLIGRMFYTDSINTVITFMLIYATNVAVSTLHLSQDDGRAKAFVVMAIALAFAVAGGFAWGWLADRIGPKRTLNLVLICWMLIFTLAAMIGIFGLPFWTLYIIACAAGLSLGGVWAADRPLMLRLTPPARIGEFYGLYGMVGRFSAITGPFLWGLVVSRAIAAGAPVQRGQGYAVLTLLAMIIVSFIILRPVSDTPRVWTGSDAAR